MEQEQDLQEHEVPQSEMRRGWLLSMLFDNRISMRRYVLRTGLISLIPSLIIVVCLAQTGIINEDTGPEFKGSPVELLIGIVIIGPPMETLLMGPVLWVLSLITKRQVRLAALSALVWAGLHSLFAPAWGLGVFWPFFVFSCSYLAWRRRAWWRAILVTSCVHAFQNLIPAIAAISTQ